jgi:hypothetical protein
VLAASGLPATARSSERRQREARPSPFSTLSLLCPPLILPNLVRSREESPFMASQRCKAAGGSPVAGGMPATVRRQLRQYEAAPPPFLLFSLIPRFFRRTQDPEMLCPPITTGGIGGVTAGPLVGARVRPRVSVQPSNGFATMPIFARSSPADYAVLSFGSFPARWRWLCWQR